MLEIPVSCIPILNELVTAFNPATFFGLEDKVGQIKSGHKADLVILNSNPLDMIRNTQDISAVIKNGHLLSRKSLDSLMYKN